MKQSDFQKDITMPLVLMASVICIMWRLEMMWLFGAIMLAGFALNCAHAAFIARRIKEPTSSYRKAT